ncbi:hypothetical protein [Micromonospora taraxaci]|uniref:hypothetical protein n=1 Tax=Micromonospora taraxaci TaxID=1316803 RepID=UPI0033A02EEA
MPDPDAGRLEWIIGQVGENNGYVILERADGRSSRLATATLREYRSGRTHWSIRKVLSTDTSAARPPTAAEALRLNDRAARLAEEIGVRVAVRIGSASAPGAPILTTRSAREPARSD